VTGTGSPATGAERHLVVVGSLNVDLSVAVSRLPQPGETVSGTGVARAPGGKGANQAVAAARLGVPVRLAGLVGDDLFGPELRDTVAAQGVEVSAVSILEGTSTGMALITVDESGENMITVAAGANGRFTPERPALRELLGGARALLLQLEIPVGTCLAAARAARDLGVPVFLNAAPCPPGVSTDLAELLKLTDALIVNETEAEGLSGGSDPVGLPALGPAVAVVTLGARGAVAVDASGTPVSCGGFVVPTVDAVGAGDAFCAQFTVAFSAGLSLTESVRRACAAGALATTAVGAQAAMPGRAAVEALL
jgi:ribokinase